MGQLYSNAAGKAFEGFIQGNQSVGENPTPTTLTGAAVGSLHQIPERVVLIEAVQKGNFVSRREGAYDLRIETGVTVQVNFHSDRSPGRIGSVAGSAGRA